MLLLTNSLVAQKIHIPIDYSRMTNLFFLDAPNLTVTRSQELGIVEVCFDSLQLHPEVPHYLIFPEGKFENEVVTHPAAALQCLYFEVDYAIDLVTINKSSQVVVTLLESVRSQ
jgi:hypothetical protein